MAGRDFAWTIRDMTVTTPQSAPPRAWTGARGVAVVAASFAGLVALLMLLGALALLGTHAFMRDGDGFYASPIERFHTTTYALTAEPADVRTGPASWLLDALSARVRIRAAATGGPVFIGIARERDIDRWLGGVAHERVGNVRFHPFRYDSVQRSGTAPRTLPTEERFWAASVAGTGVRTLDWKVADGRWTAVVMHADARRGVTADVRLAAKANLVPVALGVLAVGLLILAGAVAALRALLRESPR
jgi:hypothetical protein